MRIVVPNKGETLRLSSDQKSDRIRSVLSERWNSPRITALLHLPRDSQYELLFPRTSNNLHAYR